MRPALATLLANGLRERLGCDVTVAHHLRTAWSLTTAHALDAAGQVKGLRRWGALIAQADLDDGPGLALLSHARTLLPELPAILLDVDSDQPISNPSDLAFVTGRVPFTSVRETTLALIAAMGRPPESLEPSWVGPRTPMAHEPMAEVPGTRPFARAPSTDAAFLRRRAAPYRWR